MLCTGSHLLQQLYVCRLREAEVEQEEAEAEVTHEKNLRLKEFKSEVEVRAAELEHIKSEVTCYVTSQPDYVNIL